MITYHSSSSARARSGGSDDGLLWPLRSRLRMPGARLRQPRRIAIRPRQTRPSRRARFALRSRQVDFGLCRRVSPTSAHCRLRRIAAGLRVGGFYSFFIVLRYSAKFDPRTRCEPIGSGPRARPKAQPRSGLSLRLWSGWNRDECTGGRLRLGRHECGCRVAGEIEDQRIRFD